MSATVTIDQLNPVTGLELNAKVEIQQNTVSYSATIQEIVDLASGGGGDVTGPKGAIDNALARYDGVTGLIIQNSTVLLSDDGHLSNVKLTTDVEVSNGLIYGAEVKQTFSPGNIRAGVNVGATTANPTGGVNGDIVYNSGSGLFQFYQANAWVGLRSGSGSGNVTGPAVAVDNAIVRFDSTSGKIIQNSVGILDDNGNISDITLLGVTVAEALSYNDGIKQIFNPTTTNAGVNIGAEVSDPSAGVNGDMFYNSTDNKLRAYQNGTWIDVIGGGSGGGNVTGPTSSTDNAIARFSGTDGETIQNSGIIIDDGNNLSLPLQAALTADIIEADVSLIITPIAGLTDINGYMTRTISKWGVNTPEFSIRDDETGADNYTALSIVKVNTTPASSDNVGGILFQNDNNGLKTYASIVSFIGTLNTTGGIEFNVRNTNSETLERILTLASNVVTFHKNLSLDGTILFPDNIRQTFNPGNTFAGINIGDNATDPTSIENGDIYYNSTSNKFRGYQNGAWVDLITSSAISLLTKKGDLLSRSTVDIRLPVGTVGQVLTVDLTTDIGLIWDTPSAGSSPLTTKGDLYGYSTTNARLPVGSNNGQILTVDSTAALGVAWKTPGSGGNVTGPASSTKNAIPRFGNTDGDVLLDSLVTIADNGNMAFPVTATISAGLFNVRQALALSSVAGLSDINGRMTRTSTQWAVSTPEFVIRNTETSADAHTLLGIVKVDSTPANDDIISGVRFQNDNNGLVTYASIITQIVNVATLGLLSFNVRTSNSETLTPIMQLFSFGVQITGLLLLEPNVRQTFKPGSLDTGLNVGNNPTQPSAAVDGDLFYNSTANKLQTYEAGAWVSVVGGTGSGDVTGPSSSTTNSIAVFSGTSGKVIASSAVNITGGGAAKVFMQIQNLVTTGSVGEIQFRGRNLSSQNIQYGEIISNVGTATTGSEAGVMEFGVAMGGQIVNFVTISGVVSTVTMNKYTIFTPTNAQAGLNVGNNAAEPILSANGDIYYNRTNDVFRGHQAGAWIDLVGVRGPSTATENALARFDGTTGQLLQNSTILQDANDDLDISGHNLKGATGILDTNGLSLLTFTPVTNSVNYINIRPASGSNAPILSTTGTANNIGLQIIPKGSGTVLIGTTGNFNYQRILEIRGGNNQARSPGLRFSVSITNSFVITAATIIATGSGSIPNVVGFLSVYLGTASSPIFVFGDAAITSNTLVKFQKSVLFAGVTAPASTNGAMYFSSSLNKFQFYQNSAFQSFVQGPGTVADNIIPRFNGTTGDIIQQSGISIDDNHNLISVNSLRSGVNRTFLQLHDVNLATNYIEITNAITSTPPFISVGGSDANIHLRFQAKGNGELVMNSIVNLQAYSVVRVGGLFYDEQILTPAATHAFSIAGVDKVNVTLTSASTTVTFTNLIAGGQLRVIFIAGSDMRTVNFPTAGHSNYSTGSFTIPANGIAILSIDCPTASASDLIFNIEILD